uniref:Laminin subunit alpha 3 n=1 Tax=Sphenodon punctatus TaxID=8508 RepID=A0A8D0LAX1_SPHPU
KAPAARRREPALRPLLAPSAGIILILSPLFLCPAGAAAPSDSRGTGLSLHPPYFNLAEATSIRATATCGEKESGGGGVRPRLDLYCKLVGGPGASPAGQTIQGQFCDFCNAADPNKAHPITNAIDGTERWLQSPPLSLGLKYNEVNVTLELGQLFHVAYVLIKFANSPRPDLWVLERSVDFGRTYTAWQYFAHSKADCLERFGKEAGVPIRRDDDVICTIDYSRIVPLENGEIVVSLVNGRPGAKRFIFSPTLRDFTKATNIRLRFLRTNTLLGHLISKAQRDPTVTRRYYYSIKDISIGGQCVCHGHAEVCDARSTENLYQYKCECQHNTCGETCDHCCPGYNQKQWQPATADSINHCEPCNCHGHASDCYYSPEVDQRKESLSIHGEIEGGGVCINCQVKCVGLHTVRRFSSDITSSACSCNPEHSDGCEEGSGGCRCKLNFRGEYCDQCAEGYHSFPFCIRIPIYPFTTPSPEDSLAGHIIGKCLCRFEVDGLQCSTCRPGYHSFPVCQACQCSPYGSSESTCEQTTGQCECQPGVTGQQCDRCLSAGYCQCLQHVEGPTCSVCKPLYWNLVKENSDGCTECQCDVTGTLSGVGECQQKDGDCHCKPNVCGDSCDTCEDGYYALQERNYFGCQGSVSHVCTELSGSCQCRRHIVGMACDRPEQNYYFPNLHHMKFEIEDGTTPSGRGIRFGYDPQEFPGFSWRGYAWMSAIQNEVRITLNVEKSNLYLFHVILRYINPGIEMVSGHITAYQSRTTQSKEIVFPHSKDPAFVTVPGNSFTDPFSLAPGTWIVNIMAEGVLLDYMVLLPSDYYEAAILQLQVTEPCTYSGHAATENCLLYRHLPLVSFSCVLGSEVTYFLHGGEYRKAVARQPAADHPLMLHISGREVDLELRLNIPQVGRYVVVLEYANEDDQLYTANVRIKSPGPFLAARVKIYSCKYSFLCRSVVVDSMNRIAVYELLADAKLHLMASSINFLLHKICIIPVEDFSLEYVDPKIHCIATYGHSPNQSASCVPSVYETPSGALVLDPLKNGKISEVQRSTLYDPLSVPSATPVNGVTLTSLQRQITLSGSVPHLGRYVFVIHFYQQIRFEISVLGSFSASSCPHAFGCRDQVIAENRIELDIPELELSVTIKIPKGKSMVVKHVLVVPAESYSHNQLHRKTVDKSFDFINQCGGNSFYIDPVTSSEFCKDSARSLVAYYNNGALPCNCHKAGATSPACNTLGGQCICKSNVIGSRCSRCQTGYYGFPFCKPCNCGRQLCDDITGKCICPPQTVKPQCQVCERQHFSYHPLVGCEGCNCSSRGVVNVANPECDKNDGQCTCRPGITGRQCDHCAPGSYGFPDCVSCNCNTDGTEPNVCDPQTGACLCKENVEGAECDTCRLGSFYLDPFNPKGCTDCFCFGATNSCRSTSNRRMKFVDMRNWHLETVDNQIDIPVTFNPGSNSVVADVQELPISVHSLYWTAPQSYLGEKLSSYGGYLSYQVKSFGLPSEGMTLLEKRPDVQLTGQQMKIIYVDPNNPLPDRQYYGRVQLVEGNFRHAISHNLVSREELMMILSRLDGLHIRGLYFTETQRLTMGEVGLEEATSRGSGSIAYNVETCSCPPEYVGDSCQECSPGYYRDNKGLFGGRCTPCNCNGNSNRCQDGSGICINCQYNTAGERCDRCKEGYFGDASQRTCRVCPCPNTNSFATGCLVNGGDVRCFCKEGYAGVRCESCAPGYFGNPLKYGGSCQKCNCNNNGQLGSCNRLTGECSSQEPKDADPNEDCDSCDSCIITLLKDLGTMGDELRLIKSQMQNVNASAHTLEQMKHLEKRAKDLKILLNSHRSVIMSHGLKVDELETDLINLNQDVNALQEKLQKHQEKNNGLIKTVRDSLNEYESKVNDLREALNDASGQTRQAENLNRDNGVLLEDIKVIRFISLKPKEYENLAAKLDGARKDLIEKLKRHSLSASKEPLVVRAEEHAKFLQDLARQLDEIKRNTSNNELVSCAVKAATAYDSIINAVKVAEEAAIKAASAADSALLTVEREDLAGKAKRLNTDSGNLLTQAQDTQKTLQDINPALQDVKNRLGAAEVKKNRLQTNIMTFQNDIREINRDDIDSIITSAKNMAQNAHDITTNVLEELKPIEADVKNIKSTYGSTQSADFNKALTDANNSVKKLTNQLPDLFSKIESINQQLMPIGNISENVNRIRELIQQARDAANKVALPMRFKGNSGVEVRPPSNLDDLKGYTSLSFFLQRPVSRLDISQQETSNMFVMYLGSKDSSKDYIGMAVRDGRLICVYNLGGNEAEIEVSELVNQSPSEEATLDRVKFERIYQYAKLNYVKDATSSSPESTGPFNGNSENSHTLLNLDPSNVVFYVGGHPADFTLPRKLQYPLYQGCIELDSLNENVISLYNFRRTFNLNTTEVEPCRRSKEESDKTYFEVTGYARVTTGPTNIPNLRYQQTIQTTADEGLVFFAENQDHFISLLIENGSLVFRYKLDSQPPKEIRSGVVVNDGKDQLLLYHCTPHIIGHLFFLLENSFNISTLAFRGCMKNVKNTIIASVTFTESIGVSKKCTDDWKLLRAGTFSRNGILGFSAENFPFPNDFQVGFGFHTLAPTGTLLNYNIRPIKFGGDNFEGFLHTKDLNSLNFTTGTYQFGNTPNSHLLYTLSQTSLEDRSHFAVDVRTASSGGLIFSAGNKPESSYIALYISKGRYVFSFGAGGKKIKIKSKAKYNDGQWHTVVFNRDGMNGRLIIDGLRAREGSLLGSSTLRMKPPVYLGGVPSLKLQSFVGCLRNFKVEGKLMSTPHQNTGVHPCLDGSLENGMYFFNEGGHVLIDNSFMMGSKFKMTFNIRPGSQTGVLLHTGNKQGSYLTVYMEEGKVTASGSDGAGEFHASVTPQRSLCNGKWHSLAGTCFTKQLLYYLTTLSLPPLLFTANLETLWLPVRDSFVGCLKNVKINNKPVSISKISEVHGVVSLRGCPAN